MNHTLRNVSVVVLVMFLFLFGSTTYIQGIAAGRYNNDSRNVRTLYAEYGHDRGPIVVSGSAIASSTKVDDAYGYQRSYTDGSLYAPVTGYYSVRYGRSGIERTENDVLTGSADALFYQRISDLLSGDAGEGATVNLTIDADIQQAAYDALGDHRGAVVALDPTTGAILAMVSKPSYDPNTLATHSSKDAESAWTSLNDDSSKPLANRAIAGDLYPPGSTFKLIVTSAALESGDYTADSVIPGPAQLTLPGTSTVMNNHPSGATACGDNDQSTLAEAIRTSCNTSFAELGMSLGEDAIADEAAEYGFGKNLSIPLSTTPSSMGTDLNQAQLAMSSIGQYNDRVTPLQMAMVSSAIANDGELMTPNLIQSVATSDLHTVETLTPAEFSRPLSSANAGAMRSMMEEVVNSGTGTAAQIDGVTVGGKTGTAEWGDGSGSPHAWFTGYALDSDSPIAVAVVVEQGGYGADAAAPIARDVMEARLGR